MRVCEIEKECHYNVQLAIVRFKVENPLALISCQRQQMMFVYLEKSVLKLYKNGGESDRMTYLDVIIESVDSISRDGPDVTYT